MVHACCRSERTDERRRSAAQISVQQPQTNSRATVATLLPPMSVVDAVIETAAGMAAAANHAASSAAHADAIAAAGQAAAAVTAPSALAASASTALSQPFCPNWSALQLSQSCPVGSEALWFAATPSPAWILLSQSAQGVLGLFSIKHIALSAMPALRTWGAKLASLQHGGRDSAAGASRRAGTGSSAANGAAGARGSEGLAATLMDPMVEDTEDAALPPSLPADHMDAPATGDVDAAVSEAAPSPAAALSSASSSSSSSSSAPPPPPPRKPSPRSAHRVLMQQLYAASASDRVAALGSAMHQLLLSFLSARELTGVMSVSRTWYRAANADHLWSALNEREIMRELMQSGLADVVHSVQAETDAAAAAAARAANPDDDDDADVAVPPPRPKRRSWDTMIRQYEVQLRHLVVHVGAVWHADLVGGHARFSRLDVERDYADLTHELQACIHKLHSYMSYVKKAEQHVAQVLQLKASAMPADTPDRDAAVSFARAMSAASSSRHEAVSALLLTACALVQACHRYCSGAAPTAPRSHPPTRQRSSAGAAAAATSAASSSSSASPARAASSSSSSALSPSPLPASLLQAEESESLSSVASVASAVGTASTSTDVDEQQGLRRRRHHGGDSGLEDALPTSAARPALTGAASYSAASSSSSSSSAPATLSSPSLQRSMSSPTPASQSDFLRLLPPRRWHSISDILLLMECSGLVNFPFSVEEALRLHSQTHEEEEESKSGVAGAAGPVAAAAADGDDSSDDSSDDSDDDDGSDFSDSDSDFDPEDLGQDLPPLHPLPLANPPNNNNLNANNNNQPAARARRQRRVVLIADIDDYGNIFLTALDASAASSSSASAASASASASSASSSSSSSSAAASSSSSGPASAPSSLSPSDRHERALAQALEHELNLASGGGGGESGFSAPHGSKKPSRRGPGAAKAAFKESLEFLRVQKGFDQSLQSDRALLHNQRRTMRLHESLRTVFKMVIFASMAWSTRQVGLLHLLARYATWVYLARDLLALMGFEVQFDVEVNHQHQQQMHHHALLQQQQGLGAHGHGHGHAHAHGAEGAGPDGDLLALEHLPPHALMQPLQPVLDFFGVWGGGPALHPPANMPLHPPHAAVAAAAADGGADAPAPVDAAQLRRRQCIRRVALLVFIISLVEAYNALTGSADPAWFTSMQLTWLRFLPLQLLVFLASLLAVGGASWRSGWVQLGLAGAVLLEALYWGLEFRSRSVQLLGQWAWESLAPKVGRLLSIAARVTPVAAVASSVLWTLSQAFIVLFPIVADAAVEQPQPPQQQQLNANAAQALQAQGMPIVNLNPNAQNFPLIFAVLRHNPQMRRCYRTVLYSVLGAVALECLFGYLGFQLPIVADSWRRLQVVGPVLASLLYEVVVFEGRGVLIGLALLRFAWVVDQSLPIHTLTILAPPHATSVSSPQLRPAESVPLDPSPHGPAPARQGKGSSDPAAPPSGPAAVCLTCARRRTPFFLVRLLQDLIFETHLLLSYYNSGVQALLIQRQEQTLQIVDTNLTIQLALDQQRWQRSSTQGAGANASGSEAEEVKDAEEEEDEEAEDPHVQVQTCTDCVLHSIHMQLLLPFLLLCCAYLLFSRLLPPPPYSTYREIVLSTLHYIFDRVPLVVLLDLGAGWWAGRVLRWRKVYLALSGLILAYASYVVFFSWFHEVGIWWLFPGFVFQSTFHNSSWLILDCAWMAVWTLN